MSAWVKIGEVDSIGEGGSRIDVGEHRLALFRIDSDFYAIGDLCSHAEASLSEGELFGDEVECPRHGSEFNVRTGKPGSLPATQPVPTYELRVDGNDLLVDLSPQEVGQ